MRGKEKLFAIQYTVLYGRLWYGTGTYFEGIDI